MTIYYYFYDTTTQIIYYSVNNISINEELVFIGSSNNPNKRMAAQFFTKNLDNSTGFRLKPLV